MNTMNLFGDSKKSVCDQKNYSNKSSTKNLNNRKFSTEKFRIKAERCKKVAILEKLKSFSDEEKTESVVNILGKDYLVDYNKESDRNKLKQIFSILNDTEYDWFKEERGYGNWVMYRTDQFEICEETCNSLIFIRPSSKTRVENQMIKFLKYRYKNVSDVEIPFNLSSCFMMFSNKVFNGNTKFQIKRSTRCVIDMVGTFMCSEFNDGFVLPACIDTVKVITMDGMFYGATLKRGFRLGNRFITRNVLSMSYLFMRAILPEDFKFPKHFSTISLIDARGMFSETVFFCKEIACEDKNSKEFFNLKNVLDTSEMFSFAQSIGHTLKFPNNFNIDNAIYVKGMFYRNNLNFNFYQKYLNGYEITQKIMESSIQID